MTSMKSVSVTVEKANFQASTKPDSLMNFVASDKSGLVGFGPTLDLALNAFEVMYEARHDEEIKAVVIQKTK